MVKTGLNYHGVNEQRKKINYQNPNQNLPALVVDCLWSAIVCAKLESSGNLKPSNTNLVMEMLSNPEVQQGKWHSDNMLKKYENALNPG